MSSQQNRLSSPIDVSSRLSSPQAIYISSDTSPARESDTFSLSQAAYWPPMATNHRVATEQPGPGSRAPSILPIRSSHASSLNYPPELEIIYLREQCAELRSDNRDLKVQLDTLQ